MCSIIGWCSSEAGLRVWYCAPLHGTEVVERVSCSLGRERQRRVFALVLSRGYTYTSMTPLLSSLKTRPVARQQEHAVTGMLGGFRKRQVGVRINPPASADDSMFACPSKANQATTLLLCALFKQNTGTQRTGQAARKVSVVPLTQYYLNVQKVV